MNKVILETVDLKQHFSVKRKRNESANIKMTVKKAEKLFNVGKYKKFNIVNIYQMHLDDQFNKTGQDQVTSLILKNESIMKKYYDLHKDDENLSKKIADLKHFGTSEFVKVKNNYLKKKEELKIDYEIEKSKLTLVKHDLAKLIKELKQEQSVAKNDVISNFNYVKKQVENKYAAISKEELTQQTKEDKSKEIQEITAKRDELVEAILNKYTLIAEQTIGELKKEIAELEVVVADAKSKFIESLQKEKTIFNEAADKSKNEVSEFILSQKERSNALKNFKNELHESGIKNSQFLLNLREELNEIIDNKIFKYMKFEDFYSMFKEGKDLPYSLDFSSHKELETLFDDYDYFISRHGMKLAVKANDGVSLKIYEGETFGMVGESGCGKSTFGRSILKLYKPTDGKIIFDGEDITDYSISQMTPLRKEMQIIFQDPYSSLNPRMTVGTIIGEAVVAHKMYKAGTKELEDYVKSVMKKCGLDEYMIYRYPHEFSGGQRQRIGIARCLALKPRFIVCDEAVSALDVSIQSQVINLLKELQNEFKFSYLFISHDLSVVKHISDRICVMYLGKMVEVADKNTLYDSPKHPYTVSLLSAIPLTDLELVKNRKRVILEGDIPSNVVTPRGCNFNTRCPIAKTICFREEPGLKDLGNGQLCACHFPGEMKNE